MRAGTVAVGVPGTVVSPGWVVVGVPGVPGVPGVVVVVGPAGVVVVVVPGDPVPGDVVVEPWVAGGDA